MNNLTLNLDPKRQRGLAMVEMALVTPILLLLMLAAAELGRGLYQYNTLAKATRDGARHFSSNAFLGSGTAVDAARQAEAINLVQYGQTGSGGSPLLPGDLPAVTATVSTSAGITWVTVTGIYTFQFIPGNPLNGMLAWFGSALPNPFVLTASTTMRAL